MNKKKLVIGNWKMGPVKPDEARKLFEKVKRETPGLKRTEVVMCPPFIFLSELSKSASARCAIGAQNAFLEAEGAYTGEVSPHMLVSLKISHVILGHSERRALGESSEVIAKKVSMALKVGLRTVLCVGEKVRDIEGDYLHILEEQIRVSLSGVQKNQIKDLILAYEPVWAIGEKATGAITPEGLLETVIFIRKVLANIYDQAVAHSVVILYGGSVDEKNAGEFLQQRGVGGLLVGRASLDAVKFIKIIKIAESLPEANN